MDEYERRYMEAGEQVLFREKVVSKAAFAVSKVFLAVFGLVGLALMLAGAVGAMPLAAGLGAGAPLAVLGVAMAVLGAMFSVFRSMVTTSHLHVHFGWSKRRIPHGAIEAARVVKLVGFRQGKVSIGLDGIVRTWVGQSASGRGVEVTYREPGARAHVITVGSDDAEGYLAALERARGAAGPGSGEAVIRVDDSSAKPTDAPADVDGRDEGTERSARRQDG